MGSQALIGSNTQMSFGLADEAAEETADRTKWPKTDLLNAKCVSCGDAHTLAIIENGNDSEIGGEVYSWGCGGSARTGLFNVITFVDNKGKNRMSVEADKEDMFEANLIERLEFDEDDRRSVLSAASSRSVGNSQLLYVPLEARQVACGGQHSLALQVRIEASRFYHLSQHVCLQAVTRELTKARASTTRSLEWVACFPGATTNMVSWGEKLTPTQVKPVMGDTRMRCIRVCNFPTTRTGSH